MSVGKYSPNCPSGKEFIFNCYGKTPAPWTPKMSQDPDAVYDSNTMFGDYDDEGFDSYGYSCFNADGEYVGLGCGIDREGMTEDDYLNEYINRADEEDGLYDSND